MIMSDKMKKNFNFFSSKKGKSLQALFTNGIEKSLDFSRSIRNRFAVSPNKNCFSNFYLPSSISYAVCI